MKVMNKLLLDIQTEEALSPNSTYTIGAVSCSTDSFVVAESFALRINICANRKS